MSELTGENRENGRFGPGKSGNPAGRPKGARNKATILAERLFEQKIEAVVEKINEHAIGGNVSAMRLFLDRAAPRTRDRIEFAMPELLTSDDAFAAQLALVTAVAAGEVSPREAERMMGLLGTIRSTLANRERNARIDERDRGYMAAAEAARAERAAMEEAWDAADAEEAAAQAEIFEEPAPADTPRPAADTETMHSGDDPVTAGPLAFLDYPDPRPPYPPYNRDKWRRIAHPVPV